LLEEDYDLVEKTDDT